MTTLSENDLPAPLAGLQYELVGRESVTRLNDFYNEVFGTERPVEICDWKYFGHLADEPTIGLAVEADTGRVVASHPYLKRRLWIGDREIHVFQIADVALDPTYRKGIGLYKNFVTWNQVLAVLRGNYYGYGGLITKANRTLGKRLVGYQDLMQLATWERRLNLRMAVSRRIGTAAASLVDKPSRSFYSRKYKPTQNGITVEPIEDFDDEFDGLWETQKERLQVALVRDRECLHWRYVQNPAEAFRMLEARRGGNLAGYLAMRIWSEGEGQIATVLDLVDCGDPEVARMLLDAASCQATREGVDFLRMAASPSTGVEENFRAHKGWRPAPVGTDYVVFKALPPDLEAYGQAQTAATISQGNRWFYCQGDSDFQE